MSLLCQCLCQHICHHILSWAILEAYFSTLQLLSNEVVLYVNVLCARVVGRVLCKCNASLIVAHDACCSILHKSHICHQLPQPYGFLGALTSGHVFGLHGRQNNCRLPLAIPWDGSHSNKEHVPRGGTPLICISTPINITISPQTYWKQLENK